MSDVELTIKGEIEVLRLQPDDRILVSLERMITAEMAQGIRESVEDAFPGHKCYVLSPGLKLTAVTP